MYKIYLNGIGDVGFFKRGVEHGGEVYATNGNIEALKRSVTEQLRSEAEENGAEFTEPVFTEIELEQPTPEQAAIIAAEEFTHFDKAQAFVDGIMKGGETNGKV